MSAVTDDVAMDLTTKQAADIAGMTTQVFRAQASRQRTLFGLELRVDPATWPDQRTPLWDETKVRAWLQSREKNDV